MDEQNKNYTDETLKADEKGNAGNCAAPDKPENRKKSVLSLIGALLLGLVIGIVMDMIMYVLSAILIPMVPVFGKGGSWSELSDFIQSMLCFGMFFWGMVLGIKIVGKTSMKAFILGSDRQTKVDIRKEVLPILGLYLVGVLLQLPMSFGHIAFSGKSAGEIIFLLTFTIIFAWMQTSFEELLFRGFALRIVCGDNIGINIKSFIAAIVTSVIFMVCHMTNPEVQTLSGTDAALMAFSYCIAGFGMFLTDMLAGNLLPGLLIHWLNNFLSFTIISQAVSVSGSTSIWVDNSVFAGNGLGSSISVLLAYTPVVIYLVLKRRKDRQGLNAVNK